MKVARVARLVLYSGVALLFMAVMTLHWLCFSDQGARLLTDLLKLRVTGLDLTYQSGSLARGVTLRHVTWSSPGLDVSAQALFVRPNLPALAALRLEVADVAVKALDVRYRPVPGGANRRVNLTRLRIDHVSAAGVTVKIDGAAPIHLDSVETVLSLGGGAVSLEHARIAYGPALLEGAGSIALNPPFDIESRYRVSVATRYASPAVVMRGRVYGTSARISVDGSVAAPGDARFSGVIEPGTGHVEGRGILARLDLAPLIGRRVTLAQGHFAAGGSFGALGFSGEASVANPWVDALKLSVAGKLEKSDLGFDKFELSSPGRDIAASGRFDLAARRLTVQLGGALEGKRVAGSAIVSIPDLARLTADGRFSVGANRLEFSSKRAGRVDLRLDATDLVELNPALSGRVTAKGEADAATGRLRVTLASAAVTVAGQRLRGIEGSLSVDGAGRAAVNLSVRQVTRDGRAFGGGALQYTGSFGGGAVTLDWRHARVTAHLVSRVDFAAGRLKGSLDAGEIRTADDVWGLANAAAFEASPGGVKVGDQCWTRADARLCLRNVNYAGGTLHIDVAANKLSLGTFTGERIEAGGTVEFAPKLRYRIDVAGDASAGRLALRQLRLALNGDAMTLRYRGHAKLINPYVAGATLAVDGDAHAGAVTVRAVTLSAPDGKVILAGRFDTGSARLAGTVGGAWRGRAIKGDFDLAGLPARPNGRLAVAVAGNRLALTANGKGPIDATLVAHDLAALNPKWRGGIDASGNVDRAHAAVTLEAASANLAFDGFGLGDVQLRVTSRAGTLDASFSAARSQYSGQPLGGASIALQGRISDARLAISMPVPSGNVQLHGRIGYVNGAVSGRAADGDMELGGERWKLAAPFEFAVASGVLVIGDHCWVYQDAHACLKDTHIAAARGRFNLDISSLPLDVEKPWFEPGIDIRTKLNVRLHGTLDARSGRPVFDGSLRLATVGGTLAYQGSTPLGIDVGVEAQVAANALSGSLSAKSDRGDVLLAGLELPDIFSPRALRARLRLDAKDLGTVAAFIPDIDRASGRMRARLAIDSTVRPMTADVAVDVTDASMHVAPAGISLEEVTLTARGGAQRITLDASAASGGGKATARGVITDPFGPSHKTVIAVSGDNFMLAARPDLELVATPNLTLTDTPGRVDIAGSFAVNDGSIRLQGPGEQARRPSSDVIIVSGHAAPPPASELALDLKVSFKRFTVDMYGLNSGVQGDVTVTQGLGSPRRAQGILMLVKGSYSRFGQKFDINKGRLIFSGPLDNPLVDIVSSRTITDTTDPANTVTVSLTLSGPANDIKSSISSDPPMSGASALSYLVLGHPLTAGATDSQSLTGAALALGLKQALPITRQIQTALGLSQLTVGSSGVDSTSVIAGKRFGPDLYVEYDFDVFARIGGILFNYRLTPRLSLETRTGQANSMQLIYTF